MGEKLKVGDRRRFFDNIAWQPVGDQPDGNEQFWRPATIVRLYSEPGYPLLADIRFDHEPERVSEAHFAWNRWDTKPAESPRG